MKKWFAAMLVLAMITGLLFQNCSSSDSGGGGTPFKVTQKALGLGTFVDDPVAGLYYSTSSGLTGYTNAQGQYQFNPGDVVSFYILGIKIGSVIPVIGADGTASVTPFDLVPAANGNVSDPNVIAIAQILGTLDEVSGAPVNGVFTLPADLGQLAGLVIPTSTSSPAEIQDFINQLLALIQNAFPDAGITAILSESDAKMNLMIGRNNAPHIGTVWSASCENPGNSLCADMKIYLRSDGKAFGLSVTGEALVGIWSASDTPIPFILLDPADGNGGRLQGNLSGTAYFYEAGSSPRLVTSTKYSSSGLGNSAVLGFWVVEYTPSQAGILLGETGGCANLMAAPGYYFGVTDTRNVFVGVLPNSGVASASFTEDNTTTDLDFDLLDGTGVVKVNGTVMGSLSFTRDGFCEVEDEGPSTGGGDDASQFKGKRSLKLRQLGEG